jgi:hypothetical protein
MEMLARLFLPPTTTGTGAGAANPLTLQNMSKKRRAATSEPDLLSILRANVCLSWDPHIYLHISFIIQ